MRFSGPAYLCRATASATGLIPSCLAMTVNSGVDFQFLTSISEEMLMQFYGQILLLLFDIIFNWQVHSEETRQAIHRHTTYQKQYSSHNKQSLPPLHVRPPALGACRYSTNKPTDCKLQSFGSLDSKRP